MKPILILLLSAAFLPSLARADVTFIQLAKSSQAGGNAKEATIKTEIKGGMARVDIGPAASILLNLDTADTVSLIHEKKIAVKISGEMAKNIQQQQAMQAGSSPIPDQPLTPTGKTETISGFPCEEYQGVAKGKKISIWVTKGQPDAEQALTRLVKMVGDSDPLGALIKKESLPGFPVRSTVTDASGRTTTTTVTSLKSDPLPDADFDIPSDYMQKAISTLPSR